MRRPPRRFGTADGSPEEKEKRLSATASSPSLRSSMWGISIGPNPSPGTEEADEKRRDQKHGKGGSPQAGGGKGVGGGLGGRGGKGGAPALEESPEAKRAAAATAELGALAASLGLKSPSMYGGKLPLHAEGGEDLVGLMGGGSVRPRLTELDEVASLYERLDQAKAKFPPVTPEGNYDEGNARALVRVHRYVFQELIKQVAREKLERGHLLARTWHWQTLIYENSLQHLMRQREAAEERAAEAQLQLEAATQPQAALSSSSPPRRKKGAPSREELEERLAHVLAIARELEGRWRQAEAARRTAKTRVDELEARLGVVGVPPLQMGGLKGAHGSR